MFLSFLSAFFRDKEVYSGVQDRNVFIVRVIISDGVPLLYETSGFRWNVWFGRGMLSAEAELMIFLKTFSPLWAFVGQSSSTKSLSVSCLKPSQSALPKLTKVRFGALVSVSRFSSSLRGRWSEPSVISVYQVRSSSRSDEARLISDDEACHL